MLPLVLREKVKNNYYFVGCLFKINVLIENASALEERTAYWRYGTCNGVKVCCYYTTYPDSGGNCPSSGCTFTN